MRLLRTRDFTLTEITGGETPPYAVLSHRWQQEEVTYQDVEAKLYHRKKGFAKIREACRIAEGNGFSWLWVDTCCIDKKDLVELQEAINAMFKWYAQAGICIAYLFDHTDKVNKLAGSTWFTRCWTLQELIAPRDVKFFDSTWKYIGSKRERCEALSTITGIPRRILKGGDARQCSVAQRMSWAANREATRIEDEAYSLLGLFGVSMPALYGTGKQAFKDLQEKLLQKHDQSILAWDRPPKNGSRELTGLLAESPADFASCRDTVTDESAIGSIMLVGDGVELDVNTIPYTAGAYLCALDCTSTGSEHHDAIVLQQLESPQQYARVLSKAQRNHEISCSKLDHGIAEQRRLYVHHEIRHAPIRVIRGFHVHKVDLMPRYANSQEHIQVVSRLEGRVPTGNKLTFAQLPSDEWGTTGLIWFSKEARNFRLWPVRWIALGFDANFRPVVRLGSASQFRVDDVKRPPRQGSPEYKAVWNNVWLSEKLSRKYKTETIYHSGDRPNESREREYTDEEYFNHRGFEQYTVDSSGITIRSSNLGIKVNIALKHCPSRNLPERVSAAGPGPWKVWTIDVREERDFLKEQEGRRATNTVLGASLLGVLTYAIMRGK